MQDMNLPQLVADFQSEEKCRAYLEALRWRDGVSCPRCASRKISRVLKRGQFDCDSCRYQFSVTAGTIFHDSHLPLWKWLLATYMMVGAKKGVSANQLKRTLVVSYKTAWYLCHRVRDRKSTRLNSSHGYISYAVFCLKKKKTTANAREDEGSLAYELVGSGH